MIRKATQVRLIMVTSAQLRAARAYLDWTMDKAAAVSGLNRRTILRLESSGSYAQAQPPSLKKLVAIYRQQLSLDDDGLVVLAAETTKVDTTP